VRSVRDGNLDVLKGGAALHGPPVPRADFGINARPSRSA
jgi:hypothetical protein